MPVSIVLASTSPYRRQLLERLRLPFETVAPEVDETSGPDEAPRQVAQRLALLKAEAVSRRHPRAIVIGSDQVADLDGRPIGKPFSHEAALEQPYDCAGSARIESLGICLAESVGSDDPTALIGLPLISLTSMLAACGIDLPMR